MGDVFDVPESTVPPEKWLEIPAVIELESMGSGPANFLTLMLCALIREVLKVNPHYDKEHARHIIFIEEAHNLIGPEAEEATGGEANPKQAATAFVVKMLAEVRALKEGIVIADQLPTVMAQEVIKNTGLKIGLRITSADDRGLLGSTMAANGIQMEEMATFNVGEALISYEGLMKPFKMRMNEWCGEYAKDEKKRIVESKNDAALKQLLYDRASYREICERSYIIAGKKYFNVFKQLEKDTEAYTDLFAVVSATELVIHQLEETRLAMIAGKEAGEDELRNLTSQINQLKDELKRECKTSLYYRNIELFIREHIELYILIRDKKERWKRLGIENCDSMDALEKLVAKNALKLYLAAKTQISDQNTHTAMQSLYKAVK